MIANDLETPIRRADDSDRMGHKEIILGLCEMIRGLKLDIAELQAQREVDRIVMREQLAFLGAGDPDFKERIEGGLKNMRAHFEDRAAAKGDRLSVAILDQISNFIDERSAPAPLRFEVIQGGVADLAARLDELDHLP